jgi:hypothetical protein
MRRLVVRPLPYGRAHLLRPWADGCRYGAGDPDEDVHRANCRSPPRCRNGPSSLDVLVAVADRRSPSSDGQAIASAEGRLFWAPPRRRPGHGMDGRPPGRPNTCPATSHLDELGTHVGCPTRTSGPDHPHGRGGHAPWPTISPQLPSCFVAWPTSSTTTTPARPTTTPSPEPPSPRGPRQHRAAGGRTAVGG